MNPKPEEVAAQPKTRQEIDAEFAVMKQQALEAGRLLDERIRALLRMIRERTR